MERRNRRIKREEKFLKSCQEGKRVPEDQNKQEGSRMMEGEIRREIEGEKLRREEKRSFTFWNVAGIMRKDADFWDHVTSFDYIDLCET